MAKGHETNRPVRGFKQPPARLKAILDRLRLLPLNVQLPDLEQDEAFRRMIGRHRAQFKDLTWRIRPYQPRWWRAMHPRPPDSPHPEDGISKEDWPAFQARLKADVEKAVKILESRQREQCQRTKFEILSRVMFEQGSKAFAEFIFDWTPITNERLKEGRLTSFEMSNLGMHKIDAAIKRYDHFRIQHKFMGELVMVAASRKAIGGRSKPNRGLLASWYIDENDHYRREFNPIIEQLDRALDDELEISRIRMCANENCRRIFWAGNAKQSACCTKCSAAQHSRENYRIHRQPKTERWKTKKVFDAISESSVSTEEEIERETGLLLVDVCRIARKLFESGQVVCEDVNGESLYSRGGKDNSRGTNRESNNQERSADGSL